MNEDVTIARAPGPRAGPALVAAGLLGLALCSFLVHTGRSDAARGDAKPCGSYLENGGFGEYTGDENKR